MNFKRTLRMGSKGEDVFYIKQRLLTLGYFSDKIKKISSKTFGKDTHNAVKLFQSENVDASGKRLDMDGIIGKLTWASIEAATVKEEPKEAAPFSAAGLVAYVKTKLGNPYVWGGHGQVNPSNAKMKAMETSTANYNRVLAFIAKQKRAGMKDFEIFDCSGLISRYLFDHGKVPGKRNCRHLGSMCVKVNKRKAGEDITRFLAPGDLMFRHSVYLHHVGVYIGGGMVAEAKGRDDGVVIRDINANGAGYWNRYGRLKIFA